MREPASSWRAFVACYAIASLVSLGTALATNDFDLRLRTLNTTLGNSSVHSSTAGLAPGEVHTWRLHGTSSCRGTVVVELWEDVTTAAAATPMLNGSLLCPVVTNQRHDLLQRDPGLQKKFKLWQSVARSAAPQWIGGASLLHDKSLHWDRVACALQLPYHWIVIDDAAESVQAHTWSLLVVNNRNTSIPTYNVRATCTAPGQQHSPQPDLKRRPCSGVGTYKPASYGKVTAPSCACPPKRTGIGCEAKVPELRPNVPVLLKPGYDVNVRLVANSSLNTPYSLFRLQVNASSLPGDKRLAVVLELEADWGWVNTTQDGNTLSRPRLCYTLEPTDHQRLVPELLRCSTPLTFPLDYQVSITLDSAMWGELQGYTGALYVVVMDVGSAPTMLTARVEAFRLGAARDTTQGHVHYTCPFNCSGKAGACSDFGVCNCPARSSAHGLVTGNNGYYEGPWCNFYYQWNASSSMDVDVSAGKRTWAMLPAGTSNHDLVRLAATVLSGEHEVAGANRRSLPHGTTRQEVARANRRMLPAGTTNHEVARAKRRIFVKGYWITSGDFRLVAEDPTVLGQTDPHESTWLPRLGCVTQVTTLDRFRPACRPDVSHSTARYLVLMLWGAADMSPSQLKVRLQLGTVEATTRKELTAAKLSRVMVVPVTLMAVASVLLAVHLWQTRGRRSQVLSRREPWVTEHLLPHDAIDALPV